jgi:hypothetical protein
MHFTVTPYISWLSVHNNRYKPDFYLGESLILFATGLLARATLIYRVIKAAVEDCKC